MRDREELREERDSFYHPQPPPETGGGIFDVCYSRIPPPVLGSGNI
jgi:hypothetical protein